MGEVLEFEYLFENKVMSHVKVDFDTGVVECKDFTDNPDFTVFGTNEHTIDELYEFFEERSWDSGRRDLRHLFGVLGLVKGDLLGLMRETHGKTWHDTFWIRFKGEDLVFHDIFPEYPLNGLD